MPNEKKYDKNNRIIYDFEPITSTLHKYKYSKDGNSRIVTITNKNNLSNFKTVIKQEKMGDDFINKTKEEKGEKYIIRTTYNDKGQEIRHEKINKEKKTNLVKDTIRPENSESEIWVINYEGKRNIGFKINSSNLKKL